MAIPDYLDLRKVRRCQKHWNIQASEKKRSSHNQSKWNGIPPQWNWSLTSLKKVYHIHMFTIVSYKSTMLALIDEVIALPRYRRRTAPGIVVSFVTSRVSSSLNFVVSRFRILLMYQIQKQVNYLELDKPLSIPQLSSIFVDIQRGHVAFS